MKRRRETVLIAALVLGCAGFSPWWDMAAGASREVRLTAFVGSASKPPALEAKAVYEKAHPGVVVDMTFGGSGTLLNQMKLEQTGDIYLPGSDDFMEKAEKEEAVIPSTRRVVAYLVPVINVRRGNPKGIRSLRDLARPGIRVGLGNAGAVCLGDVAEEILRLAGVEEQVKNNVVTYATSCEQTQQLLQLGEVDAIIGWDSFKSWAPDKIENVQIPARYLRVRNVPAAVSVYSKRRKAAEDFIAFLTSKQGKAIFKKHGYCVKAPRV